MSQSHLNLCNGNLSIENDGTDIEPYQISNETCDIYLELGQESDESIVLCSYVLDNILYYGNQEGYLQKLNLENQETKNIKFDDGIWHISKWINDTIIIFTDQGQVSIISLDLEIITTIETCPGPEQILCTEDGIYFATEDFGLYYIPKIEDIYYTLVSQFLATCKSLCHYNGTIVVGIETGYLSWLTFDGFTPGKKKNILVEKDEEILSLLMINGWILCGSSSGHVNAVNTFEMKVYTTSVEHTGPVESIVAGSDGLVVSAGGNSVNVFNTTSGIRVRQTHTLSISGNITNATSLTNYPFLFVGTSVGEVILLDVLKGSAFYLQIYNVSPVQAFLSRENLPPVVLTTTHFCSLSKSEDSEIQDLGVLVNEDEYQDINPEDLNEIVDDLDEIDTSDAMQP